MNYYDEKKYCMLHLLILMIIIISVILILYFDTDNVIKPLGRQTEI
jgi:hypothetical protein